jgi:hypothetical protein
MRQDLNRRAAKSRTSGRVLTVRHVFPAPGHGAPADGFRRAAVDLLYAQFEAFLRAQEPKPVGHAEPHEEGAPS